MDNAPTTPSDLIAARVRALRDDRGLTVKELAARCAAAGMPQLTAQALYKLEQRRATPLGARRPVTVDELLVLAYVLDIAPVHLMAGTEDDDAELPVTPVISHTRTDVRRWIRGFKPIPDMDVREWLRNRPASEADGRWYYLGQPDELAERKTALQKAIAEIEYYERLRDGDA